MNTNNQLVKFKYKPIMQWFTDIFSKIKRRFSSSKLWDKDTEAKINEKFPNELEQKELKALLEELLTRNKNLLETLDIKMLNNDFLNLFGKARLERIITDRHLQKSILRLSKEQLQTYAYILNYNLVDFNERIANLSIYSCSNITLKELQSLTERDRLKAISIILSNSDFRLSDLSKLKHYYEKRRKSCQEIINNPKKIDEEYEKDMNSEVEISVFPVELLYEMQKLTDLDRIRYAIIEAKYGMSLKKARVLCSAFGEDIDEIEQSQETRVIKELKDILEEDNIDKLRQINLDEDYANYEGTINIVPNLKNAYLHEYQKTLYQINEEDYIGTQSIKIKGKRANVRIYNVLGKNNDRADFNIILTSLGGIYFQNHNYNDFKADWDRQDENHTISCSYIGNDFLVVVDESHLLAFSDIGENELIRAHNEDGGFVDFLFGTWEDLRGNKFLTPQNEINTSKLYNELLVERKVERNGKLVNRTPTFAVFIAEKLDDINDDKNVEWQETKRLAAELGIPIAVIDKTQCAKLEFEKVQEMVRVVKEEKRMDLIPSILHKIENNRATQTGELGDIRNKTFSDEAIKKCLEEVIGAIITSDIGTFNQGIEEFVNTIKKLKKTDEHIEAFTSNGGSSTILATELECKTYIYDEYMNRLRILYSTRNGLNKGKSPSEKTQLKHHDEERDI